MRSFCARWRRSRWRAGNEVNLLQFTVTRQHVSVAEAAAYVLTAFSSLPGSGTATIICGASGENR